MIFINQPIVNSMLSTIMKQFCRFVNIWQAYCNFSESQCNNTGYKPEAITADELSGTTDIPRIKNSASWSRYSTQSTMWRPVIVISTVNLQQIKDDRPLTCNSLNAPWLLKNRPFQWTGNDHSQLPLSELGKPSPNIDLLRTTGSNGRA